MQFLLLNILNGRQKMTPKKASGYQNRRRKLKQQLQVEKCPKSPSFFKSNINV